jgi:8-oxo-dGTP pyrophosphatase MutT (NUDIX family)
MKIDRVSLILPYDKKMNVLFQDRKKISKKGEEYGFFGGHIENNETPEQALEREMKEELNLNAKDLKIKFFKKFIFKIPEWEMLGERNVYLVELNSLRDLRVNEGFPIIIKFKDIFSLNLTSRDREMLEEIYKYLFNKNITCQERI